MSRGQEEMVGFALIVVIVAIIGIGFIALSLRDAGSTQYESAEIGEFLDSLMHTTSECTGSRNEYLDIGSLIRTCYTEPMQNCFASAESVCTALNRTLAESISASWGIGPDNYYTGFTLRIDFEPRKASLTAGAQAEEVLVQSYGVCNNTKVGNEYLISDGKQQGTLVVNAELCLAEATP
ncbi:hypothetical protein HYZ97_02935 [Candidatus Pacearchaeota archaeon]|nr:hypothetical protein [Candidatus Pacearchaeota archaeon]